MTGQWIGYNRVWVADQFNGIPSKMHTHQVTNQLITPNEGILNLYNMAKSVNVVPREYETPCLHYAYTGKEKRSCNFSQLLDNQMSGWQDLNLRPHAPQTTILYFLISIDFFNTFVYDWFSAIYKIRSSWLLIENCRYFAELFTPCLHQTRKNGLCKTHSIQV